MVPSNVDWAETCQLLFHVKPYAYELNILDAVFRKKAKRITIRATTRAGKSYTLAEIAIIKAVFEDNIRVGIIAPSFDKTRIIMDYVATFLAGNQMFDDIVMVEVSGLSKLERLRKEVSKRRITFRNGSLIDCKSVDLDSKGFGVLGWAYDCLPAGTLILTDNGKVRIEDIVRNRLRCKVLSRSKSGNLEFMSVTKYAIMNAPHQTTIATKRNKIKCTMNHPIWVKGKGFVKASEIRAGDEVGVVGYR